MSKNGTRRRRLNSSLTAVLLTLLSQVFVIGQVTSFNSHRNQNADNVEKLLQRAQTLNYEGNFKEALTAGEDALRLAERPSEADLPLVALCTTVLARIHWDKGDFKEAEVLNRKALDIREKAFGADHPDVAQSLYNLAKLLQARGDYSQAEALYKRSRTILERKFGVEHQEVALVLDGLGTLYSEKAEYATAEANFQRAVSVFEKSRGVEPEVVIWLSSALSNLAVLRQKKGEYRSAGDLYQRALNLDVKTLGQRHPQVATDLNNLASLRREEGYYERAEILYKHALTIILQIFHPEHPKVATFLNNFGELYREQGRYSQAEEMLARSLQIQEKVLDANHIQIGQTLSNLGALYQETGDYLQAEVLFVRAKKIAETALGNRHPDVAKYQSNLGLLYAEKGDRARAEQLYLEALSAQEKGLGPEHPLVAVTLTNIASIYLQEGNPAQAAELQTRVLRIQESAYGKEHPSVANSLSNLAVSYQTMGMYTAAAPLLVRSLRTQERIYGRDHPALAEPLTNLSVLEWVRRNDRLAVKLLRRALTVQQKFLHPSHPSIARSMQKLALVLWSQGDYRRAVQLLSVENQIREKNLSIILSSGSERQKLAYIQLLKGGLDLTVSFHTIFAPRKTSALKLAVLTVLQRKGRVLDALAGEYGVLRRRMTGDGRKLVDELARTRGGIATLYLQGPSPRDPDGYQANIRHLLEQEEELEQKVSTRSADHRMGRLRALDAVQRAIPSDAVLVEFIRYQPCDPRRPDRRYPCAPDKYAAYVLRSTGDPSWADLGEAAHIDDLIALLRNQLLDDKIPVREIKNTARDLDRLVMQPIRRLLGNARNILVSPDGELNLIPFGVLVDEHDRYLIQRFTFTYLAGGRDLLRLNSRSPNREGPMVVADPLFDLNNTRNEINIPLDPAPNKRLCATPFKKLASTAEAKEVGRLLGVSPLTEDQATEKTIKEVNGPSILHIATHGFFCGRQDQNSAHTDFARFLLSDFKPVGFKNATEGNALVRSGLALAGANSGDGGNGEDGILTALEASSMDLFGTKLVVLSACETALGDTFNGEGVYGLRRALTLAGAESQVMSLWQVDDWSTASQMKSFYAKLLSGEGRSEALSHVQLDLLKGPRLQTRHPYYWAAFVHVGDWRAIR